MTHPDSRPETERRPPLAAARPVPRALAPAQLPATRRTAAPHARTDPARRERHTRTTLEQKRLLAWLETRSGIAHAHDALDAGFTRHVLRNAVQSSSIERIRRSWLATPSTPIALRRAAAIGGRLACLSAARHHGLWTLDDERLHLAVARNASRFDAGDARVHWNSGPVVPHRYELVEPVVDALAHIADCQPFDHALATWESAVRLGRTTPTYLDRLELRSASAQKVRAACGLLSDSGIESIPVARLARIGIAVNQQVVIDGHRVDGLIGDRLVYQIDGYSFHRTAEQRRKDIAEDRRLVLMGYTVLRYDYQQVLFEWDAIEAQLRGAIAIGLHLAPRHPRR